MSGAPPRRLLIVGAGLMGSSLGLAAAAAGYQVWLDDADPRQLELAVAVGAGRRRDESAPTQVDIAVAAVPPAVIATVVAELSRLEIAATITHLSSVQTQPQVEIEALRLPSTDHIVGGHPIAGKERAGAHHASADLFRERPWVICPTATAAPNAVDAVSRLASDCGASVTLMSAGEHDALLAALSHVPQLVASALAGSIRPLGPERAALAGAGLRDTSRLADSGPELWAQIIAANADEVAAALRRVLDPLNQVLTALEQPPSQVEAAVRQLLADGRSGRRLLAGKHGAPAVRWATVTVVVPDEPGALARLLADAAAAEVNVEDIRVDHAPGHPVGLVELDVAPGRQDALRESLTTAGWSASATTAPE